MDTLLWIFLILFVAIVWLVISIIRFMIRKSKKGVNKIRDKRNERKNQ